MIVYADVLIFLNTLVDYFLLLATAKLSHRDIKTVRIVLASLTGGIACLYIFLPRQVTLVELLYKIITAFVMSGICFEFKGIKSFLKVTTILFLITCAYGGVMFALWLVFKPYGMVINNSVVYFNISPVVLVVCTAVGYVAFCLLWRIFGNSAALADRCDIIVFAKGKSVKLKAIADTGNSLEDTFGRSEVIIAAESRVVALFGGTDFAVDNDLKRRYQILPCSTVSGYSSLDAYRCDTAIIECGKRKITLQKPLLAVSKVDLTDDYDAIINPKILR